jgi:hypothetical protein
VWGYPFRDEQPTGAPREQPASAAPAQEQATVERTGPSDGSDKVENNEAAPATGTVRTAYSMFAVLSIRSIVCSLTRYYDTTHAPSRGQQTRVKFRIMNLINRCVSICNHRKYKASSTGMMLEIVDLLFVKLLWLKCNGALVDISTTTVPHLISIECMAQITSLCVLLFSQFKFISPDM